jgi:limonene-1,2-epoxide hydrolase
MTPKEIIQKWVDAFNNINIDELADLYAEDAVNHQVFRSPIVGRAAIRAFFEHEFSIATMVCVVENIFEDGEWGMLEWSDPLGLRGCGFFHIVNDKIKFQRGYFDRLSFIKQQGLSVDDFMD